jgi:glycosyltransferase involved in cell wall biosynthesis
VRIALVHDWLTGLRGGEKVLSELCDLLPDADILTLIHRSGSTDPAIEQRRIITSTLNDLPGVGRYYRHLLPLMPLAMEGIDARAYDLIVSSSHCVAKGVIRRPGSVHVCYCHTPMRYAWSQSGAYDAAMGLRGLALKLLRPYLRAWDRRSAGHVDVFVANSSNVADRIRHIYGRDAEVVYPPVDTAFYTPADVPREDFYLVVGAMAPYKRVDQAVEACRKLGRRLVVIGAGQQSQSLLRARSDKIELLGAVDNEVVRDHFRRAKALLFPGEEDFGIVPVEAIACGCPVIAYGAGGVLETVTTTTGRLYTPQTVGALVEAIEQFESGQGRFESAVMSEWARAFQPESFRSRMRQVLERAGVSTSPAGSA